MGLCCSSPADPPAAPAAEPSAVSGGEPPAKPSSVSGDDPPATTPDDLRHAQKVAITAGAGHLIPGPVHNFGDPGTGSSHHHAIS
ncbi:unnamed protein product [Urochloa humidicola]